VAKLFVQAQATSNRSEYVFVQDSASTTGGGKTGIAYNASGLTAYYVRPGGSATAITLATQTVTGAWSSGGWVEVDATNLPGIYRFDIPNAVFATGVDHAVVMLKGASGMAPVSLEYQLTGFDPATAWLTSAQTASAVLDAVGSSYVTAGSIGYAIQNSNVASISGSTSAADELEGALLHNGTDYISAQLIAGGNAGAGDVGGSIIQITEDPQEVTNISAWVNDWHTYVLRLVDENGTPYDITNDTLSVTYTNVATGSSYSFGGGSATITKQMNGQGIISVLNPAAYPTAAVIRITIGAAIGSTARRFGPLEIEVLAP
jgi:hypothetical protein